MIVFREVSQIVVLINQTDMVEGSQNQHVCVK